MGRHLTVAAFLLLAGIALLIASPAPAQSVGGEVPGRTFDVASVRENRSEQGGMVREVPNGVTYQGVTLVWLMSRAFGIPERDILGGPDWIRTRRFDVDARTEANVTSRAAFPPMLEALLKARFDLQVERVQDERPVYALVVARDDRRLGPRLTSTTSSCSPLEAFPSSPIEIRDGKITIAGRCGVHYVGAGQDGRELLRVWGSRVTMGEFASVLSKVMDRPVLDRTALTGEFDFSVQPFNMLSASSSGGDPLSAEQKFFVALEVELGLKLQSTRAAVTAVKILSVQPPTSN